MNTKLGLRYTYIVSAFVLTFVCTGMSFWFLPYNQVSFPSSLLTPALWSIPLGALLLRSFRITPWWLAALLMGTAAPAAVMARVVVDCAQDPTAHNLWPFEIILASFVSYPLATTGTLVGLLLGKFFPRMARYGGQGNRNSRHHV